MRMEHSEETLSTRDLAATNEPAADGDTATSDRDAVPADRDTVTDTTVTGRGSEEEPVYDQQRVGHDEATPAVDEATPPVDEATPGADESVAPQHLDAPAGNDATPGPAITGTAGNGAAGAATADANGDAAPLMSGEASSSFQRRWEEVQTRFVDEPRGAVEAADGLVANLMKELAEGFAQERERLEAQWDRGEDISTEDLRVALQRYRSFFHRLLAA
jgi:hypothetical protein